jgi:streptomycin 6-kinase
MDYKYSNAFAHSIASAYGTAGTQWLAQLPTLIGQCIRQWNLRDVVPYTHLTYNYVLSGMMRDTPIVLKLRCDHKALEKEVAALHAFAGYGCVNVIAHNNNLGAVLLEQVIPGNSLVALFPHDDATATRIASGLIRTLHQAPIPSPGMFPTLEQVLPTFDKRPAPLAPFIPHAQRLRHQLLQTQSDRVLLHGDFHHDNILSSRDGAWRVIDPEGIIGDPVYDLGIFIRNPLKPLVSIADTKGVVFNRISDFADFLGYERQCIYDWTYLQTVSSAYWSIEDGLDVANHVTFLTLLHDINF